MLVAGRHATCAFALLLVLLAPCAASSHGGVFWVHGFFAGQTPFSRLNADDGPEGLCPALVDALAGVAGARVHHLPLRQEVAQDFLRAGIVDLYFSFVEAGAAPPAGLAFGEAVLSCPLAVATWDRELAGKAVVFKVKLNSLTAPEYPELDDEFAKDVSEFDTLDEYKADLKKTMLESLQKEIDSTYRSNLLKIASDNMTVEIPEVMVKDKAEDMIRNQAANYGVRGADITTEQLASMMGIDADTMENVIKPAADFQCRVDVLLETVAKQENIEVSDEEAEKYIKDICDGYGGTPEDLLSAFSRDFIINEYKKEKAADMIEESAKNVKGKKFEDYVKEEAPAEKAEEKAEEKPKKKTTRRSTKKAAAKEEAPAEPKEEAPAEEETKE